jgi:diamine N-acetyltransferase
MTLVLRATESADLGFVLAAEADPGAAPFIVRWSREAHELALADRDQAHLLVLAAGEPVGFMLLAGLSGAHRAIELRRIVVTRPGQGLGREALGLVLDHSFTTLGAHRVWLDVKVHNERARRAYGAVGFVEEAVLRDALAGEDGYESLLVMSVLEDERSGLLLPRAGPRGGRRGQPDRSRGPGTAARGLADG